MTYQAEGGNVPGNQKRLPAQQAGKKSQSGKVKVQVQQPDQYTEAEMNRWHGLYVPDQQ